MGDGRERRLPDDIETNFEAFRRECANPQACECYFKTQRLRVGKRWEINVLPGTYCTCLPPTNPVMRLV